MAKSPFPPKAPAGAKPPPAGAKGKSGKPMPPWMAKKAAGPAMKSGGKVKGC